MPTALCRVQSLLYRVQLHSAKHTSPVVKGKLVDHSTDLDRHLYVLIQTIKLCNHRSIPCFFQLQSSGRQIASERSRLIMSTYMKVIYTLSILNYKSLCFFFIRMTCLRTQHIRRCMLVLCPTTTTTKRPASRHARTQE